MRPSEEKPIHAVLEHALQYYAQEQIAELVGVTPRHVRRWVSGETTPKDAYMRLLEHELSRDERPAEPDFTFVDLFAGIGGLRRGFEKFNGRCVFTSEWDASAQTTYKSNFPDADRIHGDIVEAKELVPKHDVLLAGFPCQPFSLAGVSKKNSLGRAHGFRDKAQGTLFFRIVEILERTQPKAFLLENVRNLQSHDGGRTYEIIMGTLRELGYNVFDDVIDASAWVPQRRTRVFIAGFRDNVSFDFENLSRPRVAPTLGDILHSSDEEPEEPYTISSRGKTVVDPRYTLSDHLWQYLQDYAAKHRAKGNGFGCSVFSSSNVARTLSARYHKDGSEILIAQRGKNPRRLTPRECARLMGFDARGRRKMVIPVSDTQAYRQFGNSVVVPLVTEIARCVVDRVLRPEDFPPKPAEVQRELFAEAGA